MTKHAVDRHAPRGGMEVSTDQSKFSTGFVSYYFSVLEIQVLPTMMSPQAVI